MVDKEWLNLVTRDYESDVNRLNSLFKLSGKTKLANHVPPHTYVGNLSSASPENCVLLMGINPFLGEGEEFNLMNVETPKRCIEQWRKTGDKSSFDDWINFQEGYFLSDAYNGKHFTKIGNLLGRRWFKETYSKYSEKIRHRMVMHNHLIEFDVVPYYSKNASFDSNELADAMNTDPALIAHKELISSIIRKTKPKWIQVNGNNPTRIMIDCFMKQKFEILNDGPSLKTEIRVGFANFDGEEIPVLMHKFLKSPKGPQSYADWNIIWETWNNWLNTNRLDY